MFVFLFLSQNQASRESIKLSQEFKESNDLLNNLKDQLTKTEKERAEGKKIADEVVEKLNEKTKENLNVWVLCIPFCCLRIAYVNYLYLKTNCLKICVPSLIMSC
jgi:hypothetical protein